jgi:hypothetical protein
MVLATTAPAAVTAPLPRRKRFWLRAAAILTAIAL